MKLCEARGHWRLRSMGCYQAGQAEGLGGQILRRGLLNSEFPRCPGVCARLVPSVMSDSLQPMGYSLPGSSVYGILQARILEWVAGPSSRGSSWPRNWTCISSLLSSTLASGFFTISTIWEAPPGVLWDRKMRVLSEEQWEERGLKIYKDEDLEGWFLLLCLLLKSLVVIISTVVSAIIIITMAMVHFMCQLGWAVLPRYLVKC